MLVASVILSWIGIWRDDDDVILYSSISAMRSVLEGPVVRQKWGWVHTMAWCRHGMSPLFAISVPKRANSPNSAVILSAGMRDAVGAVLMSNSSLLAK